MPDELTVPMLISAPHCGTKLTDDLRRNAASEDILKVPDTDWFVHELYDFANELNIPLIQAEYSRYVIDLNRQLPGEADLYQNTARTTGLVPLHTFAGKPIYQPGWAPIEIEVQQRIDQIHKPYYAQVSKVLSQLQEKFPIVML
jgi:N-formylglutamate deformylase